LKKYLIALGITMSMLHVASAQSDTVSQKTFTNYVGVQANELFKQIFSLSSNTTPITNPYLITYVLYENKWGVGLNLGLGYNYSDLTNKLNPSNSESKISASFYRVGICRKKRFGRRFEIGYGLDYVGVSDIEKTTAVSGINQGTFTDSTISVSSNNTKSHGFGAEATLAFYISPKVSIGTEVSYYYQKSDIKQNSSLTETETEPGFTSSTFSESNAESLKSEIKFSIPAVLFLNIKF
jgi:hypothetical protein